jgi:hypothetical protein
MIILKPKKFGKNSLVWGLYKKKLTNNGIIHDINPNKYVFKCLEKGIFVIIIELNVPVNS